GLPRPRSTSGSPARAAAAATRASKAVKYCSGRRRILSGASRTGRCYGRLRVMARCGRCGGQVDERFRFCPWCSARQRSKIGEFFAPHPRDAGKALRVSRYLTDDPHVRFSVWNETGVAEGAVSLTQQEAARLARFLRPLRPPV